MAVQIITREGTVRQQGDTSSWSSSSPSSSSPSRSTEGQTVEAKINNSLPVSGGLPTWYTNPETQENINTSNRGQFQTVQQVQNESKGYHVSEALKQGYAAGRGQNYSTEGLTAPDVDISQLSSKGFYDKTQEYSQKIDTFQNSLLQRIPGNGIGKQVITGVTNIPEMAVSTVGAVPLGLESMARNRGSAVDSIALGLGATVGGIEQKARDSPGELVGEFAGGYLLGKGAGAAGAKLKAPKIESIPFETTERQFTALRGLEKTEIETLGTPRSYFKLKTETIGEKQLNPSDIATAEKLLGSDKRTFNVKFTKTISETDSMLNTNTKAATGEGILTLRKPSIINAEQKTLFGDSIIKVDKGAWEADFSGISPLKSEFRKQFQIEQYGGKETFDFEFATKVENTRVRMLSEIIPEKEKAPLPLNAEKYFDVPTEPRQSSLFDNFGEVPEGLPTVRYKPQGTFGEAPGYFAYDRIGLTKNSFKNTIRRLSTDEKGSLVPIQENKIIPGLPKSELDVWKRDILLEELQPKTSIEYQIRTIPNKAGFNVLGFSPLLYTSPASLGELVPAQKFNQGVPVFQGVSPSLAFQNDIAEKTNTKALLGIDNINILGSRQDTEQDLYKGIISDTKTGSVNILDTIPAIKNDIINPPSLKNDLIPDYPGGGAAGNIFTPPYFAPPSPALPIALGGFYGLQGGDETGRKLKKTKRKMVKNQYGDIWDLFR